MDLKYIGNNIRKRRKELGLTIVDVQKATGISNGNLSGIETGKSAPSAQAIIALSKVLKCSTDYLLLDNEAQKYSNLDSELSADVALLIERFNALDESGRAELLEYAQFKLFQIFQKNNCSESLEKRDIESKQKYIYSTEKNNNDIIA